MYASLKKISSVAPKVFFGLIIAQRVPMDFLGLCHCVADIIVVNNSSAISRKVQKMVLEYEVTLDKNHVWISSLISKYYLYDRKRGP